VRWRAGRPGVRVAGDSGRQFAPARIGGMVAAPPHGAWKTTGIYTAFGGAFCASSPLGIAFRSPAWLAGTARDAGRACVYNSPLDLARAAPTLGALSL